MRYLGNKTKLLNFINYVINKYDIKGEIFADLFAGTASVGDYFKDRFTIISNDYMSFSSTIAKAKLLNEDKPIFEKFVKNYGCTPFEFLNSKIYEPKDEYFILNNYTPLANRMYFTEENAKQIDGMRIDIEELYKLDVINEAEYYYLLASLLESVMRVSNTSGTYQAFFKFWDNRALKTFKITPLEIEVKPIKGKNLFYCCNSNKLVREISGDIAYIDPPYTTTQYINSYHLLETINKYDSPEIFGKTGRRSKRELSGYSNKQNAFFEFEDLFRQLNFNHILVSYSNQSIISLNELIELAKLFAKDGLVYIETMQYREYSTNNPSYKNIGEELKEAIIYFKKDNKINKSPLNYSGSKDQIMPQIIRSLPKHIDCFVDTMGGAFNVGANIVALNSVYYNEYNKYIFEIVKTILTTEKSDFILKVREIIGLYNLQKKDRLAYNSLRSHFNNCSRDALELYVLSIYAFQNMVRFNNSQKMNTPIGNNEFNEGTEERIVNFKPKVGKVFMLNKSYKDIDYLKFSKDTIFYFDPPYFITNAEYNDGRRGLEGWDADKENELLALLAKLDANNCKFMLSNVVTHKGKTHHLLLDWVEQHNFKLIFVGKTGIKYPREEVLIINYEIFE